ncbi:hypothetical protein F2P81_015246, partial [Scophthalmus maximus]
SPGLSSGEHLEPPVFVEPLGDCRVDEGGDITLRGVLAGSQPIKVSWLHNGEVARFGKPSLSGGGEVTFQVTECLPEDAGAYTCLAVNGAGKTSCCAAVCVREVIPKKRADSGRGATLHFENPPQQLKVKAGQPARLLCLFSGSPPVVSCWIRNKEQIADGPELWTENADGSSTLVIAETKPQHTGCYTIVVRDRKSSAQHTLTLSVIERPQPPASSPVISRVSASSLVLSWSGPCYDGGSAVLGYVVEVKKGGRAVAGDWSELTAQCKSTSYRVCSGLQPRAEYCFRVRAYNTVGASEPGPVSPVVRMEQKDSAKLREEEAPLAFTCVTIDSSHKVTDQYILQEKLGMGKFGLVFKLTHRETGRVCAGKFYKGRRAKEREAACKEIELMNYLHHPKLVQCLAAYDHKPEIVMVMEFIAGGELFERIVDDSFEHTESASVHYMQQILEGIAYMHEQSIIHLDLKPENIVCVDTTGTSVKIIDFGLAARLDGNTPLKVMHGTPEFVAPEVINYEPVCLATDMWSIGVICYILSIGVLTYVMLTGESPFLGDDKQETFLNISQVNVDYSQDTFEGVSSLAVDFIESLLVKNPRKRATAEECLNHPWLNPLPHPHSHPHLHTRSASSLDEPETSHSESEPESPAPSPELDLIDSYLACPGQGGLKMGRHAFSFGETPFPTRPEIQQELIC